MNKLKLSFIVPAHNEEKIIGKALNNLLVLPYKNYEVLIGLDGCTDKTEEIVKKFEKKSNKFKHYNLKSRSGKPEVVDKLIKKSTGDIIIIHDSDWIFKVSSKKDLELFLSVFRNKEVGGIAESFPAEWTKEGLESGNIGYKMVAYSNYFWIEFQKERFSKDKGNYNEISEPKMFLTNIFRKNLYRKNITLGDDFERTNDIMSNGKKVLIFKNENVPRMVVSYDQIRLKDLFKQKIRTSVARDQLSNTGKMKIGIFNYYIPSTFYILKNAWKSGFYIGSIVSIWVAINIISIIISKFKSHDTKKGWNLRAKR